MTGYIANNYCEDCGHVWTPITKCSNDTCHSLDPFCPQCKSSEIDFDYSNMPEVDISQEEADALVEEFRRLSKTESMGW